MSGRHGVGRPGAPGAARLLAVRALAVRALAVRMLAARALAARALAARMPVVRMPVVRMLVAVMLAAGLAAPLAGCGDRPADRSAAGSAASSAAPPCLPAPVSQSPGTPGVGAPADGGRALPDAELRCFAGGRPVRTREIRGPALVNLWASSCAPCRTELPALRRYAERAAGRVAVVGVVTADRHAAAQSVIDDLGLGFGMIDDPDGRLLRGLGRTALPVTLLVTADGRVAYTYVGPALDEAGADRLAREHLGVGAVR